MKRASKNKIIISGILAFLVMVIVVGFVIQSLHAEQAEIEVCTYFSDDKEYSLTIYQVGEPEWSFGNTNCRFDLCRN